MTVETGTGVENADSYVSIAEADSYNTGTSWGAAETAEKEAALITASEYLDIRFNERYVGRRQSASQSLSWPRYDALVIENMSSYELPSVPVELKKSACYLAQLIIDGTDLYETSDDFGSIKSESSTFGPFSESIEYAGGKSKIKSFPKVTMLMNRILKSFTIERA